MPTGHANGLMPSLRRIVLARQSAARSDGELLGAFVAAHDADAFAELVRRHGPMVLGVCRRVIGDASTADDAFQASFLVLARRAAAVRPREQVGSWLYGVAYRTAMKARTVLARRRSREQQVGAMPEPTAPPAMQTIDWADVQQVIDEELAKLPDKLRVPVVLCDLEGRPQREVAQHLKVPAATLATRLASARRTLAARLTRRGVTLSGGALAGLLGTHASVSAVPPSLAAGVVRAAEAVSAGAAVNSLVSAHAVQLSEGVMRMMMLAKLKTVAVALVAVLTVTTGLGLGLVPAAAGDAPGTPAPGKSFNVGLAAAAQPDTRLDDAAFLRRLCLDARGTLPTDVEMWYFTSDEDTDKRAKVVGWVIDDEAVRVAVAKRLGVPVERVRFIRVKTAGADRVVEVALDPADVGTVKRSGFVETYDKIVSTDGVDLRAHGSAQLWTWKRAVAPQRSALWVTDVEATSGKLIDRTVTLAWVEDRDVIVGGEKQGGARIEVVVALADTDADFLKRVLTDARGSGPTALELKYFTEDKDPKKREKLIDTLLKDPAVQKKLGEAWKAKMLSFKIEAFVPGTERLYADLLMVLPKVKDGAQPKLVVPLPPQPPVPPVPPVPPAPQTDKLEKLVGELIAAGKSDEALIEALTLATLGRLPTDAEKKLALANVTGAKDRKASWITVAKALAASADAKGTPARVKVIVEPVPPKPPVPPVPPKP